MSELQSEFDFCILGAGIAGLSLADALREKNYSVAVLDKSGIATGASGTPGGLVNPATGRKAKKSWRAEECYAAIKKNLEKVASCADMAFFNKNGVLRPALTEKMGRKMKKQFDATSWPDDWCEWKDEQSIKEMHPGIQCVGGGLWIPIGITVDVGSYLKALAIWLEKRNVLIETGAEIKIRPEKDQWIITTGKSALQFNHLVFATGFETTSSLYWKELPLTPVKGQVACFEADASLLNFDYSISSLGYIARVDGGPQFIQGSTYEHDFDHLEPDVPAEEYLRERLRRTLPELEKKAVLKYQWAGVRASTPNRKPFLGRHQEIDNLHVFTGLGSKGLLYGKFLADHYADHLASGTPLYKKVSVERLYKRNP